MTVSQNQPLSFHRPRCLEFTQNGAINKKYPVTGRSVAENTLLMRDQRRMARLVEANWNDISAKVTAQYKSSTYCIYSTVQES